MSSTTSPASAARQELGRFDGTLIGPDDSGYDEARSLFNAMIDKRPALIARAARTRTTWPPLVKFAREHDLPIAIRGGSHNGAGLGSVDDGVVIDLSQIRDVKVDPEAAHRPRGRRRHLGRGGRRDERARARHAERDHRDHRRRRPHPRRRPRAPDPQVRARHRPPDRGRGRARERRAGPRERRREPGPVLGAPGRRRELRRGDRVRVPARTSWTRSSPARRSGRSSPAPRCCGPTATSSRTRRAS